MDEQTLLRSVEQARRQLSLLRARVAASGIQLASPEIVTGLGTVEETLDKLQAHCAFLRDELEQADAELAEHQDGHGAAMAAAGHLRAMTFESLVAEEGERRFLANQLQSGLGQELALAKMHLAELRESTGAELRESLQRIESLLDQAHRSFRSVAFRISPLILYDLGLLPAIEWLAEDVLERFGIETAVADEGQAGVIDETVRVIAFRVVRELVIRAGRGGGAAQRVTVRYHGDREQLRVAIDCGWPWVGAHEDDPAADGLFALREQLVHVGGTLQVDCTEGHGTTVTVTIPLTGSPQ